MTQTCSSCRFWLIDKSTNGGKATVKDGDIAFGSCRRVAPRVLGELAALGVPRQVWGRDADPDEDLWSTLIYRASPQPVTESAEWCGQFEGGKRR